MVDKGMITGINLDMSSKAEFCEPCIKAKATHKPFPKESKSEYESYGDKVVSDVWGPAPVKSLGGKHYYLLFMDLFSHEERVDMLTITYTLQCTTNKHPKSARAQRVTVTVT